MDRPLSAPRGVNQSPSAHPSSSSRVKGTRRPMRKARLDILTCEDDELVQFLVRRLQERKVDLMHQVVTIASRSVIKTVYMEAAKLEASGGLLNANNERRKPGGTFLTVLKGHVSTEEYKAIYARDNQQKKEVRSRVRNRVRKKEAVERDAALMPLTDCLNSLQVENKYAVGKNENKEGPEEEEDLSMTNPFDENENPRSRRRIFNQDE